MKDCARLDDKLAGAQMPPQVRIGHIARRHGEKTQRQDGHENTTRLEKLIHPCKDTLDSQCNGSPCLAKRIPFSSWS